MPDKVRVAVMGLGRAGNRHAAHLAAGIPGAELAGVFDPNGALVEKAALEWGVRGSARSADDWMEDPAIHAVVIAAPTPLHGALIKQAAASGKHVFVEKPLTGRLDEADEIIEAVERSSIVCQVGFMRRFDPAYAEAKRRIAAGDIGKPIYFKAVSRDPGSPPAEFIKHSGGIFLDMAIHEYDMARFLMNSEVSSVTAHGQVLVHDFMKPLGDIDQSLTYMTFNSGAAGDAEVGRNAFYGYDIRGEVIGTEGSIAIGSLKHHDIRIQTRSGSLHDIVPSFPQRFQEAFRMELVHFIECVRTNQKPSVTERDGKAALAIALAAQQSYETGATVNIGRA
ncbi:Gfo/Idh/MocA family oxidoreductase [Paenibacillus allorhizosphaerae]|uniref:Scyllo-inositol 2-dehydrogenase (NAD(+)) n=1 Tax=Paenibacillus allorhizosphaerae TaxID=2849866 RepID=A0ABM8VRW7_9BACL|nr:Gfo/Idh/MocA family oxidoreductase [Paenibacillus allorhizosphaerae]CAG7655760.1 scyllo-inositol 2-dehydrogenase (NAD(+)) [Paenibacillus allorhizosphaerae]